MPPVAEGGGRFANSCELFWIATTPAGWGVEVVHGAGQVPSGLRATEQGPWALARGAPSVLKSTPEEAVVSLDAIVLLMMFTFSASSSEIPAPSQPATLLVMMLLVTVTLYQLLGVVGKASTSPPLMACRRMPPPLPLSAPLPMIRLALITRPGPVPSLGAEGVGGRQSRSVVAPQAGSTSGAPMIRMPPPLVGMVGFVLWLNRIELCSMSPLELNPIWAKPPPSPVLRLPHTQL